MSSRHGSPIEDLRHIEDALTAVRAQATELSQVKARPLLVEELRKRGIMLPPPIVDFYLADMQSGAGPVASARRTIRGISGLVRFVAGSAQMAKSSISTEGLQLWDNAGTRVVVTDPRRPSAEVILDSDAQDTLAIGGRDLISVWLDRVSPAHDQAWKPISSSDGGERDPISSVAVFRGELRLGVLGQEASQAYESIMRDAANAGVLPVVLAVRSRAADGS